MGEYIVEMPKEPAKVVRDGWNVRIEWQYKQREEIVRCRDCKKYGLGRRCGWSKRFVTPDGFCAWGERADNFTTCKCGEDIETNGRESVTCPSCGRVITE